MMILRRAVTVVVLLGLPPTTHAGMTVYDLNDVVRLRVEDVSFFALVLLASGLGLRFLWNHVAKGIPILPRLSYSRALCLTVLLSLFLLLVLTMISGARELLTPGVWRRQGSAYVLNDPASEPRRRQVLGELRTALADYARAHAGLYPPNDFVPEIPDQLWRSPDREGTRYLYPGGSTERDGSKLIACEPATFGDNRLVLLASGEIRMMKTEAIHRALPGGGTP